MLSLQSYKYKIYAEEISIINHAHIQQWRADP